MGAWRPVEGEEIGRGRGDAWGAGREGCGGGGAGRRGGVAGGERGVAVGKRVGGGSGEWGTARAGLGGGPGVPRPASLTPFMPRRPCSGPC